jgi:hypothetical protein
MTATVKDPRRHTEAEAIEIAKRVKRGASLTIQEIRALALYVTWSQS